MLNTPYATPVVLLGAFHHAGVAMTRSLGRLGVRVYVVESTKVPATTSRYCRGFSRWDLKSARPEESVAFLLGTCPEDRRKTDPDAHNRSRRPICP